MANKIKLNFEGKELGFHFGLGFLGELLDNLGFSIDDLQSNIEKNPFKVIPKLMHTSYAYNLEREGKDVVLKLYDFIDVSVLVQAYICESWIAKFGGALRP